jgi:drug/metabolite transporter (DMT)-like permease
MPDMMDLVWYSIMLALATLNAFALYSLFLKTTGGKANIMKLVFVAISFILLTATCLWLKDRNDVIWKAFIEYVKMQTGR